MAYCITPLDPDSLIYITVSDTIADEQMLEMLHEISQLERYKQYDQLVDFQQVEDYSVTPQGLSEYTRRASALATVHHASIERKIAIVVRRDPDWHRTNVYCPNGRLTWTKKYFPHQ